jgi:hypothetical protein
MASMPDDEAIDRDAAAVNEKSPPIDLVPHVECEPLRSFNNDTISYVSI